MVSCFALNIEPIGLLIALDCQSLHPAPINLLTLNDIEEEEMGSDLNILQLFFIALHFIDVL
jgi:hypothetical protein